MPDKSIFSYHDTEILKNRQNHIEFFLNYLANHFVIKTSKIFRFFLTEKNFLENFKLQSSSVSLTIEQAYDKTLSDILVNFDVVLGKKHVGFDENVGNMLVSLVNYEISLKYFSRSLNS